jgi:glycosyltransferase involved in cell wall biosynthesis
MNPKLSVITVCLNDKEGLRRTVSSVLEQTFSDYEYIIIDGGSHDESADVIKTHESKITYWVSEKDNGIYHAMNKGIEAAKGTYSLFLNSGDILCNPDVLETVFINNLTEDIVYCDMMYDCGDLGIKYCTQPPQLTFSHLFSNFLYHPSTFIKTDLFKRAGKYNEQLRIASDYEFFLNAIVFHNATCRYLPLAISKHNNKGMSSLPENFSLVMEERKKIHTAYFPHMLVEDLNKCFEIVNSNEFKKFAEIRNYRFRKKIIYFLIEIILKTKIK